MAVCFQLFPIGSQEAMPLTAVDAAMCWHFRVGCHPTKWHGVWYDIIGFKLACGKSFQQVRQELAQGAIESKVENRLFYNHLIEITDWLETRFTVNSWSQWGRRD